MQKGCAGAYVDVSDERALVMAARNLGFVFKTRLPDCVSIEVVCDATQLKCSVC